MKIKKLIPILLLTLALVACNGTGDGADSTAPTDTTPVTEALPASVMLTQGGAAVYTFIRSDYAEEAFIDTFSTFVKSVNKKTDVQFRLSTDWLKRGSSPDASTYEILVGKTNHPETLAVASRIGADGYAVSVEGNKVVVYGATSAAQKKANNAFLDAFTQNDAGDVLLNLPAGGILESGKSMFFSAGNAADYVIVAAKDDLNTAQTLQKAISDAFGYTLNIVEPSAAETAHEILIGSCGRDAAKAAIDALESHVAYLLKVDGGKLVLGGRSQFSNTQAVEHFINTYAAEFTHAVLHVPADLNVTKSTLSGAEHIERTDGTDLRVSSFNILSEEWNDQIPIKGRDSIVSAFIFTYMPDVIGLQELSNKWYAALPPLIESQYTFVNKKNSRGEGNYTGMAYNHDTVKLIEDGCEIFSQGNSSRLRLMNWGLFEMLSTGRRFVVINTHLDINRPTEPKNAFRLVQAKEMGERVVELQKQYSCPIIITGDYNCHINTDEYKLFVSTAGVKDAQLTAATTVNADYKSTHNVYSAAGPGDTAIDHITYTDDINALLYVNHNFAPVINASDHNPLMVDFKFN